MPDTTPDTTRQGGTSPQADPGSPNTLPPFGVSEDQIRAVLLARPENPVTYEGWYEIGRLTYEQLDAVLGHDLWTGQCWQCDRAFVPANVSVVATRRVGHEDDEMPYNVVYFHHPWCWELRQRNFGDPWTIPDGPVTWRASDPKPGRATEGNIGLDEGTVTILVHGEPVIGIDVHAGTVFAWPDGEDHTVVARFTPVARP